MLMLSEGKMRPVIFIRAIIAGNSIFKLWLQFAIAPPFRKYIIAELMKVSCDAAINNAYKFNKILA